jgi:hypothetical protein
MMKALQNLAQTFQADGEMKRAAQTLNSFKFDQFRCVISIGMGSAVAFAPPH